MFDLTILDWVLLGILLVLFIGQVYFYSRYMAAPARRLRGEHVPPQGAGENAPGVSVILCAHNESYNLEHYLQRILAQDYPLYEVIVVDDGSEDSTRDVLDRYMLQDSRLHTTFVPIGARVRSTKKLALTLAAKSAQYDYLLLTDADCCPESPLWIAEMVRPLLDAPAGEGKAVSLGFGAYFYQPGFINRVVRYDTLFNGLHYLGAALCGHPYMGVGRNLAYRKSLFFETGGFTHLMDSRAGDDDLFVNHVSRASNTAVVLSRESYTWSLSKTTLRDWWQQKRRHLSVSPSYRPETKWRLALEPMVRGLFYAMVIALIAVYQISIVSLAALGLFLVRWIMQTILLNVSAHRMGQRPFSMFTVLGLDVMLPLVSLWMLAVPKHDKKW